MLGRAGIRIPSLLIRPCWFVVVNLGRQSRPGWHCWFCSWCFDFVCFLRSLVVVCNLEFLLALAHLLGFLSNVPFSWNVAKSHINGFELVVVASSACVWVLFILFPSVRHFPMTFLISH